MRPRHRAQQGQAIVLIALMLTIIIGMAALAIDGARAYALRRDLQAAVDAAALAAGDKLQQTGNYISAEQAATNVFATNLRLYDTPNCPDGYGSPGPGSYTVTCNFSDGTALKQVASSLGPQGSRFALTATRSLQLQFARILTNGIIPTIGGVSSGSINNLAYTPAVAALDQDGCGGAPSTAVSINGSGTLNVNGDIVSNGAITVSSASLRVAGDIYARCQSTVGGSVLTMCYPSGAFAPCTYPDVVGATRAGFRLADPNYPAPAVTGGPQSRPGTTVIIPSGTYAVSPNLSRNTCYFLGGGVYMWQGGFNNSAAFVSNELKPPDEPSPSNNQVLAVPQFWNTNGVNCAGSFRLVAKGGSAIVTGTWAVEVTAVRPDSYNGTPYTRESAPSMCKTVSVGPGQVIQVQLSNVPGATSYNVYVARPPATCASQFGLAGSIPVRQGVLNDDTSGCPFGGDMGNGHGDGNGNNGNTCSLGGEDQNFDSTVLGLTFLPTSTAPAGSIGSPPPDSERSPLAAGLPNQNPARGAGASGDRANENNCDSLAGAWVTCPAPITPGAVEFYLPAGGCLTTTNLGDTYSFSGYQFNWVAVWEPGSGAPPANTCSNTLGANGYSAYIGLVYVPSASVSVTSPYTFEAAAVGGLVADSVSFSGSMPTIKYGAAYAPVPPASRLIG